MSNKREIHFEYEGKDCGAIFTFGVLVDYDESLDGDGITTFEQTMESLNTMKGQGMLLYFAHLMYCDKHGESVKFSKREAMDAFLCVDLEQYTDAINEMAESVEKKMKAMNQTQGKRKGKAKKLPSNKSSEGESPPD